jgi:hypothetical protein
LLLTGPFRIGVGLAHSRLSTGHHFKITSVNNTRLRGLDNLPPAQAYSRILGHTREEWAVPPLAEMVRLYPLGVVVEKGTGLLIRSPLRVNEDGSFLMNAPLKEGSSSYMMVGTRPACLKAVGDAVKTAIDELQGAQPLLAIVFIDTAWQLLLEMQGSPELEALRAALGDQVPIAGAYTFGQITGNPPMQLPQLLNQHIQVILLAA